MARASEQRTFAGELLSATQYKRNQGRMTRRLTGIAVAVVVLLACWRLQVVVLANRPDVVKYGVTFGLGLAGLWFAYRLVNYPKFADFLVSVEAEMDKVSWASKEYLIRATGVVLGTMGLLAAFLLVCDLVWRTLFGWVGFLRI
ncbi:MAG: preprotein translocase subunit SecE [Planctomycetaceae bacterium]